jgi:hypothetical protein
MANVREIKKEGSPSSYMERILISEDTVVVYNKSKTFAKKRLANEWVVTHKVEVRKTHLWVMVKRICSDPVIHEVIPSPHFGLNLLYLFHRGTLQLSRSHLFWVNIRILLV